MLSRLTRRYLLLSGNLVWLGGGMPSRFYNYRHGKYPCVTPRSKNRLRRLYERSNKFFNLFYIIFVAYRLFSLRRQHAPLEVIVQTAYVLTCYTVSVVLDFQALLKWDVTPYFVAEYMKIFQEIEVKYAVKSRGDGEKGSYVKCNVFLTILFVVGDLIFLQNFLLMRKMPTTAHFLTSLLGGDKQDLKIIKVPLMLMQCWVWYNLWTNIYFYIFPIYVYTCAGIRLMRELNPTYRNHRTSPHLRDTRHFIRVLNSFRVLHSVFMDSYRIWVQPSQKSITMTITTLALYGVIRLNGRQARIMAFAATFALLYLASVYRKLGLLFETSTKLRATWLYDVPDQSSRWMKKYVRSVQVFRVDVGQYYYVNKTTVVTILYTILNGTITLLLGWV